MMVVWYQVRWFGGSGKAHIVLSEEYRVGDITNLYAPVKKFLLLSPHKLAPIAGSFSQLAQPASAPSCSPPFPRSGEPKVE